MNDPHPAGPGRFVGRECAFDHDGRRLRGTIVSAVFAGLTTRGSIPDYRVTVRGQSGRTLTLSLVESYLQPIDS